MNLDSSFSVKINDPNPFLKHPCVYDVSGYAIASLIHLNIMKKQPLWMHDIVDLATPSTMQEEQSIPCVATRALWTIRVVFMLLIFLIFKIKDSAWMIRWAFFCIRLGSLYHFVIRFGSQLKALGFYQFKCVVYLNAGLLNGLSEIVGVYLKC